jgi:thiamine pyrophosphokinase
MNNDARPVPLVVVVAGGDPVDPGDVDDLPGDSPVIAADSGIDHARALGWRVDVAVGDFDSVTPAGLAAAEAEGTVIDHHPAAKDHTDLELALDVAMARGARRIVVVGGHGGRLDHLLGNALLLAAERYAGVALEARFGPARVHVARPAGGAVALTGSRGGLVTLLAAGGPAEGVTTEGLLYPLAGETLAPGSTRGVSNELSGPSASVSLRAGTLLVVQPGERGTHALSGAAD